MTVPGFLLGLPVGLLIGIVYAVLFVQNIVGWVLVIPVQWMAWISPFLNAVTGILSVGPVLSALLLAVFFILHTLIVLLPYWGATIVIAGINGPIAGNQREWFCRGSIMGINWGANFILLHMLLYGSSPVFLALIMLVQTIAIFPPVTAGNRIFQGFLGWFGWVTPMALVVTFAGLVIFVLNLVIRLINPTPPPSLPANFPIGRLAGRTLDPALGPNGITIDWATGSVVMHGGFFTIIPDSGYNMGNVFFVHAGATGIVFDSVVLHEGGHTLNASAMGAPFHTIGAIDQNVFPASDADAYAEKAAESHRRGQNTTFIDLW